VLAVVLVLDHRVGLREAAGEALAVGLAFGMGAIGVAAPVEVAVAEIGALDQTRSSMRAWRPPVGAGFGAVDPRGALAWRARAAAGFMSSGSSRA
jgi:hypothetical protein